MYLQLEAVSLEARLPDNGVKVIVPGDVAIRNGSVWISATRFCNGSLAIIDKPKWWAEIPQV